MVVNSFLTQKADADFRDTRLMFVFFLHDAIKT